MSNLPRTSSEEISLALIRSEKFHTDADVIARGNSCCISKSLAYCLLITEIFDKSRISFMTVDERVLVSNSAGSMTPKVWTEIEVAHKKIGYRFVERDKCRVLNEFLRIKTVAIDFNAFFSPGNARFKKTSNGMKIHNFKVELFH